MRRLRIRVTLRRLLVAVAILALLLTTAKTVHGLFGPRYGGYLGVYRYIGPDWKWHEVRGGIIFVKDGMIFID